MATYLIGDIQGCYDALQRLLDKVRFDTAADRLWSCGDLVNRGGQSLEVLRLLESLGDRFLATLGNHDIFLLGEDVRCPDGQSKNRELREVLLAGDRQRLMGWLRRQPLMHHDPDHGLLMMHAGLIPQWDATTALARAAEVEQVLRSDQAADFLARAHKNKYRRWRDERTGLDRLRLITAILTRIRFCDASGKVLWSASGPPGTQPAPYRPWFKHSHRASRDVRIVFGHWAALGLRIRKRTLALDSGCVWGGRLSAWRLEDERLFQVPGKYR
ncbi:symmetrical bis(5'-nucleosyl)-tetraphosphatase [Elongatibacter sediminis]|uniref:bis(5'-nucleosyl)-tetraphosphatase (symmetrical) n=1 Tax=Elongatibacter sediminis TaxID=3119006 RepID=A0AAW9RNT7_9GAMM